MKSLILTVTAVLTLLCACSKQENGIMESMNGGLVNVSFVDEPMTRAFFGTTAAAENWEKTLSSMSIFVFDNAGNLIIRRAFSSEELTNKQATFPVPNVTSGNNCDFYVVANMTAPEVADKTELLAILENTPTAYNGSFAEVATTGKRSGGFVLSGNTTQKIAATGTTTSVPITLKRTVAKVAIEVTPSASFGSFYPGAIRVDNITIKKSSAQTPVFQPASVSAGARTFTTTQASNAASGKFQNLFYLYENETFAPGNRVVATITATYDSDGNFSTPAGQMPVCYDVELTEDGGAIKRNGYYRMAININGLAGSDCAMTITVADWETPITQNINVGM